MWFNRLFSSILIAFLLSVAVIGQQTNPVDRQVSNPITDTPNINPISPQQSAPKTKKKASFDQEGGGGEVVVYSDRQTVEGEKGKRIVHHSGNVDVHYGIYRLQADEIIIYEAENKMVAKGSVIFDQGDDQRITGATGIWNYKTKLGTFEDTTGFTNQTNDGTVLYFTAERVERVSLDELVVTKGRFTACDEAVPKWSFTADYARIKIHDRLRLKNARFRVKNIPLLIVPFASIPIKEKDRSSGFLTPSVGYSGKGLRLSTAYYKTLGDSADVTFRGDLYSARGFGYGLDLRTRANSRSYLDVGFYAVKDRILGPKTDAKHPDQGGSIIYAEGVHYFPNGFTASVDFRLTSSLAFRQEFSDGIQQIISPIEVSQIFINKSWNDYTLDFLTRSQVISIPNVSERTRNLPSVNFEKRPSMLSFLNGVYFSFKTSLEGVSRKETVIDLNLYKQMTGGSDPVVTPAVVQRFDIYPELTYPFHTKYFNFTATGAARVTFYSNSFNDQRQVVGTNLIRKYGEFSFDVRPVALAKNYYNKDKKFRFRHVIEPYLTYTLIKGVDNFNRIIRFDYVDTATNTNEIEFGVTNRFYTRKFGQAVTSEAQKKLAEKARRAGEVRGNNDTTEAEAVASSDVALPSETIGQNGALSIQPYEIFSVTVRGKYFFDKTFGGALIPGQRNQIEPITALSFYTFGGVPRKLSPLSIDATYRPQKTIFVNSRMDYGVQGDGLRDVSATIGYNTPLFKFFQTFYYTRAVTLIPSLAQYADPSGKEAGTLRGSQWSPSFFVGNRDHGLFGGTSFFFDFQNRRASQETPLISSLVTVGYSYNCCSLALQFYTFNVGVRKENKLAFSFRLNGIGTFGSQQFGQGLR